MEWEFNLAWPSSERLKDVEELDLAFEILWKRLRPIWVLLEFLSTILPKRSVIHTLSYTSYIYLLGWWKHAKQEVQVRLQSHLCYYIDQKLSCNHLSADPLPPPSTFLSLMASETFLGPWPCASQRGIQQPRLLEIHWVPELPCPYRLPQGEEAKRKRHETGTSGNSRSSGS